MAQAPALGGAQQLDARRAVGGREVALAALAPECAAVRQHVVGFARRASQAAVAVGRAPLQRPAVRQSVLHEQLVPQRMHADRAVGRFAEEARGRQGVEPAADGRDAAVERRALARRFDFVGDRGVRAGEPDEGWRCIGALGMDVVAEAVPVLVRQVEPVGHAAGQRAGEVGGDAPGTVARRCHLDGVARRETWLFGQDVDSPAGFAAAVQRRRWPFQDLDRLGAGDVAHAVVAAARTEAVDHVVRAEVGVAGEAAHGVAVPQAAQVALAGDAAGQFQRAGQRRYPGILQQVGANGAYALRQVERQGVGLGCAGHRQVAVGRALAGHDDAFGDGFGRRRSGAGGGNGGTEGPGEQRQAVEGRVVHGLASFKCGRVMAPAWPWRTRAYGASARRRQDAPRGATGITSTGRKAVPAPADAGRRCARRTP
jgi:hypothetical protein